MHYHVGVICSTHAGSAPLNRNSEREIISTISLHCFFFHFFAGIRLFNGISVNTESIARGFGYMKNVIDVYSNSWGPADSGFSLKRLGRREENVLEEGAKYVRTNWA